MLKIKDDVDLKELEKFGFIYDKQTNEYNKSYFIEKYFLNILDRIIHFNAESLCITIEFDTIYDLIQAGLVEKV